MLEGTRETEGTWDLKGHSLILGYAADGCSRFCVNFSFWGHFQSFFHDGLGFKGAMNSDADWARPKRFLDVQLSKLR